jgi:SAM-dependent methyltransferase
MVMNRPSWQLPKGVDRGTWDYVQSSTIATEYEAFLQTHPLFQLDSALVAQHLSALSQEFNQPTLIAADLGCGTARIARQWLSTTQKSDETNRRWRWLNVDLSRHMLQQAHQNIVDSVGIDRSRQAGFIQANLAEPRFIQPGSIALAVSLFSSLGMVRGKANRIRLLQGVYEWLSEKGQLIVHAHNRYACLRDPGGLRWLLSSRVGSWFSAQEFGDRVYPYRGLPAMFLHIYSRRELLRELKSAGFSNIQIRRHSQSGDRILPSKQPFRNALCGGFFAIATKE